MQLTKKHLRYFKNSEFVREGRNWLPMYNPRLLILLDTFRHLTGPCILSPHPLALGRIDYPKNPTTLHKYDSEDGVRAIDVFPTLEPEGFRDQWGLRYMDNSELKVTAIEWIDKAEMIGIAGIGLYPEWTLNGETRPGLHLDVRPKPTQWGYLDGKQVTIEQALEAL